MSVTFELLVHYELVIICRFNFLMSEQDWTDEDDLSFDLNLKVFIFGLLLFHQLKISVNLIVVAKFIRSVKCLESCVNSIKKNVLLKE